MAVKKSELYSSLWKSCDELRGGMDASQYKDYILTLLFVKYVSDRHEGNQDSLVDVPENGSFTKMVSFVGDKNIGEEINKAISALAEANDLKGVIDLADFNDPDKLGKGKAMVDRLSRLINIFNNPALDFRSNRADGDDLLGDAYEYLMRHFATESGKSKGQFYTPAEVSRVIAKVVGVSNAQSNGQTIYDPTCGSGSLLLKAHDEAKSKTGLDLALYGQEMDNSTCALAKMNMFLHDCPSAELWQDNTLAMPYFKNTQEGLKTFDFAVANPPFSSKAWSNGLIPEQDVYHRFTYGIPPNKNGDYAFLLHILTSLKSTGKGAVILPHGVLFRGGAEASIRKKLITQGYIKGIIGLPANLFYGTGIPACIIVLDKEHAAARKGLFLVDASKGFIKDGNKNRLRAQDIHKIVDVFNNQIELDGYSRMVPLSEISDEKNDFNLNIPRYIDNTEAEDIQDIEAHLRGGIPTRDIDDLSHYWKIFPAIRAALFQEDRPGYCKLKVAPADVKHTIFSHPEFTAFQQQLTQVFVSWRDNNIERLKALTPGDRPKILIEEISEDLLRAFDDIALLDAYDVYQRLMDYWEDIMQDDAYMIVDEDWQQAAQPRLLVKKQGEKKITEKADLVVNKEKFKMELIPISLVVSRYFQEAQDNIDTLTAEQDNITSQITEIAEEHASEEGLLADALTDSGKLTKKSAGDRIKEIEEDKEADEERKVLKTYLSLVAKEAKAKKKVKDAQEALDQDVLKKYPTLSIEEIRSLVVEDKWFATLSQDIQGELDRVSQGLAGRIRELAERYESPLPVLTQEVETLSKAVEQHLKLMGMSCN
ncbi:MAG: type I restriction endonuclease subunit M [Deltaproteobacteria bacterium]|nr:type I restriction endonuclease subunit M [Deltaproteobacteria bacterium]|tara:strand:+ start:126 stop:2588 length:2463 start_codon:yes stop_codon:yes gene_type:complete